MYPPPSILLNHLHIPTGASLMLWDKTSNEISPLDYLPDKSPNFENLSHITMVNLRFSPGDNSVRLGGPSGSICLASGFGDPWDLSSATVDHQLLCSIRSPRLPTVQRLAVSMYTQSPPSWDRRMPGFPNPVLPGHPQNLRLIRLRQPNLHSRLEPRKKHIRARAMS